MSQPYPPDQGQPSYQQQQPYPQLPAQPPFYPPVQPAPKKRGFLRSPLGISCGVLAALAVLIIVIIAIASAASGGGSSTANNPTPAGQSTQVPSHQQDTPTTQPTTSNVIGKPVQSGGWTVTVNKVSTSTGREFDTPKAGDTFLVVNVTLKNTDSSAHASSSLGMFALKDASGQTYQQDLGYSGSPDGSVASGGLIKGDIAYEIPKSVQAFILQFIPGLDASQLVEWNIKAPYYIKN